MNDFLKNPIISEDMDKIYNSRDNWDEFRHSSVYITGASGMIASYVTMFFISLNELYGYKVDIYAGIRNKEKAEVRFGRYCEREYFHIISKDVIEAVSDDGAFDYIIHAASLASPQYYGIMPVEIVLPNIVGTYELLEFAKNHNVKGILFFSSGATYGLLSNATLIDESMAGDLDYLKTGNFYGESKRCGEMLCRSYFLEYGVNTKSIRIHHTYGPTLDAKSDSRVFAEFVGNVLDCKDIVMKSDGSSKRAFCYITDTVEGILKVLLDGKSGESYNIGNNKEYISIFDLATTLVEMFPERGLKVISGKRNLQGYTPSDAVNVITIDTSKIEAIGWRAKVSVKDGFYRTVKGLEQCC